MHNILRTISFFLVGLIVIVGFFEIVNAEASVGRITKIKYTLNGNETEVTLTTPVNITIHGSGLAFDPVEIYTFPEPVEGTIASIDLYYEDNETPEDKGWMVGDGVIVGSGTFAGNDGIAVTKTTNSIYIGLKYLPDPIDEIYTVLPRTE